MRNLKIHWLSSCRHKNKQFLGTKIKKADHLIIRKFPSAPTSFPLPVLSWQEGTGAGAPMTATERERRAPVPVRGGGFNGAPTPVRPLCQRPRTRRRVLNRATSHLEKERRGPRSFSTLSAVSGERGGRGRAIAAQTAARRWRGRELGSGPSGTSWCFDYTAMVTPTTGSSL
jgi:hypothetical protein